MILVNDSTYIHLIYLFNFLEPFHTASISHSCIRILIISLLDIIIIISIIIITIIITTFIL